MFGARVNRIRRPKLNPVGKELNVSQVQPEITEVDWRLNFQLASINVNQPDKRPAREDCEDRGDKPNRKISVSTCNLFALERRFIVTRGSPANGPKSGCQNDSGRG